MKEDSSEQNLHSIQTCRAKEIAGGAISECMTMRPRCQYAIPFGKAHFCLHPLRTEIVHKTELIKDEKARGVSL